MTLKVAFQMDPLDSLDFGGDSTYLLGLEAQKRGYHLFFYEPQDLFWQEGGVFAFARSLTYSDPPEARYQLGKVQRLALKGLDVIWLRQDPPFDMAYVSTTHLLEWLHPRPFVVNAPHHVRNAPEKLWVAQDFAQLMPPTLITRSKAAIEDFRLQHKDLVIKPLFGNGGDGIFRLRPEDENLAALLDLLFARSPEPLMVQKFLPAVRKGDKRILLADGEAFGAIDRFPPEGEIRANMHIGGKACAATLDARDKEIVATLGPALKARDLIFAGIDVIGGYLTEINLTSPTGLQELFRFSGIRGEQLIWNAVEKRLNRQG